MFGILDKNNLEILLFFGVFFRYYPDEEQILGLSVDYHAGLE